MRRTRPLDAHGLASRRAARTASLAVAVALAVVSVLLLWPRPVPPTPPPPPPPALLRVGPPDGPARPTEVRFLAFDSRPATAARLLALGQRSPLVARQMTSAPDGVLKAAFELAGDRARLVVVPEDADVAVSVFDLGADAPDVPFRILSAGSVTEGVLVDRRGVPQAAYWVCAEIEIPPAPEEIEDFAQRLDAVEVSIRGTTLSIGTFADAAGRFRLPGLPESGAKIAVRGRRQTERYVAGPNLRLVLPDEMER